MQNASVKLLQLRKILLEKIADKIQMDFFELYLRRLSTVASDNVDRSSSTTKTATYGLRLVPFFQCVLAFMSDLNGKDELDRKLLDKLLTNILNILATYRQQIATPTATATPVNKLPALHERTWDNELKLILMRTIRILLSKSK